MTLCTLSRVRNIPVLAGVDDARLVLILEAASAYIEKLCRRVFASAASIELQDGDGTDTLFLQKYPTTALTKIEVLNGSGAWDTMLVTDFILKGSTGEVRFAAWNTNIHNSFPEGFQNIRITHTSGYTTIPEDLQEATAQLVAWFHNHSLQDATIQSESLGAYSVSMARLDRSTLPAPIQDVIALHRSHM